MRVRIDYTIEISDRGLDAIAFASGLQTVKHYDVQQYLQKYGEIGFMKQLTMMCEIDQWVRTHPPLLR